MRRSLFCWCLYGILTCCSSSVCECRTGGVEPCCRGTVNRECAFAVGQEPCAQTSVTWFVEHTVVCIKNDECCIKFLFIKWYTVLLLVSDRYAGKFPFHKLPGRSLFPWLKLWWEHLPSMVPGITYTSAIFCQEHRDWLLRRMVWVNLHHNLGKKRRLCILVHR